MLGLDASVKPTETNGKPLLAWNQVPWTRREDRGTVPDPWENLGVGFKTGMGKKSGLS